MLTCVCGIEMSSSFMCHLFILLLQTESLTEAGTHQHGCSGISASLELWLQVHATMLRFVCWLVSYLVGWLVGLTWVLGIQL